MLKVFSLVMIPPMLTAQTGASVIFGTVIDSSGAALPSASFSATSEATGVMEKVNTNEAGNYVPASQGQNDWVTHNLAINDTHIFSPAPINAATLTEVRKIW
jgi:hypothetical protein